MVIPKEGSNVWIDGWVIPKNARHKENALKFLDFLCRPEIALKNFEYITYSTPEQSSQSPYRRRRYPQQHDRFPTADMLKNCETYTYLGSDMDFEYNELWNEVKAY
ncbi:MAG: extracellular solute-binding protein [Lachnospiraceae bacterium]